MDGIRAQGQSVFINETFAEALVFAQVIDKTGRVLHFFSGEGVIGVGGRAVPGKNIVPAIVEKDGSITFGVGKFKKV